MQAGNDSARSRPRPKAFFLVGFFVVAVGLAAVLYLRHNVAAPDPRCAKLLSHPQEDVAVPLPDGCSLASDVPPDRMVDYLENERKERGLVFKSWIRCDGASPVRSQRLSFDRDSRWLPTYVPGAYQFRQTVVLVALGPAAPQGSSIAGQVCIMPRQRYVSLISGQCDGKFAVWE